MSLAIREAEPDDAAFIAWAMQESGRSHLPRGTWEFLLPGPEPERLRWMAGLARADARSFCHYSGFLVGEAQGRPVAALCGYQPGDANAKLFLEAVNQASADAGWPADRVRELLGRFAPLMTCAPDPGPETWVVEWVATAATARRRGYAGALLDALLARGRERGLAVAHLGVLIGNEPARAVYERAGFRLVDEKRHPEFERATGAPGMRFMERPLAPA